MVNPQMRREAVLVMQLEVELSQRRACGLMELYRATCRYRRRRGEDQQLRVRLRELAEARRRFGYRRLQILLQREGWQVNHKRVYRLYVEEKLALWRKRGRKRSTVRQPLPEAVAAKQPTSKVYSGTRSTRTTDGERLRGEFQRALRCGIQWLVCDVFRRACKAYIVSSRACSSSMLSPAM